MATANTTRLCGGSGDPLCRHVVRQGMNESAVEHGRVMLAEKVLRDVGAGHAPNLRTILYTVSETV